MIDKLKYYLFHRYTALAIVFLYAVLSIVSTTFSWSTAKDALINPVDGEGYFHVEIAENFAPVTAWELGTDVENEIRAVNEGSFDALVRISFEEVSSYITGAPHLESTDDLTGFVPELIDMSRYTTANGWYPPDHFSSDSPALSTVTLPAGTPSTVFVLARKSTGAPLGYNFVFYNRLNRNMMQRVAVNDSDLSLSGGTLTVNALKYSVYGGASIDVHRAAWGKIVNSGAATVTPPLSADIDKLITNPSGEITLNYASANVITALDPVHANNEGKWYYENGWFYYIGLLPANEISPVLLKSFSLDAAAPPEFSGMELRFIMYLEGQINEAEALTSRWGIPNTDPLYDALSGYCQ
ncbi:MAG: hypothetical protein FWG82_00815 [Oscillospiraceae bacterium]|nr:hypothetical protein [Oscillospiraceae bacterium]